MDKHELKESWHNWVRGVLLGLTIAILAGIYALKLMQPGPFVLLSTVCIFIIVIVVTYEHCFCSLLQPLQKLVSGLSLLLAGVALLGTVWVEFFWTTPVLEGRVTLTQPDLEGYVPSSGGVFLDIGLMPGGAKTHQGVTAEVQITSGTYHKVFVARLNHSAKGSAAKAGPSTTETVHREWIDDIASGGFSARLKSVKPDDTIPLQISASQPGFAPASFVWFGLGALLLALAVGPLVARRGVFPAAVVGAAVLVVLQWLVSRGLPPAEPVLPFAGYAVVSALGGSLVGWTVARGMKAVWGRGAMGRRS